MAKNVQDRYKKHELRDHIYNLPGMYAGSDIMTPINTFIYDDDTKSMIEKDITYIPALFKCFVEIIVNSLDQSVRL